MRFYSFSKQQKCDIQFRNNRKIHVWSSFSLYWSAAKDNQLLCNSRPIASQQATRANHFTAYAKLSGTFMSKMPPENPSSPHSIANTMVDVLEKCFINTNTKQNSSKLLYAVSWQLLFFTFPGEIPWLIISETCNIFSTTYQAIFKTLANTRHLSRGSF